MSDVVTEHGPFTLKATGVIVSGTPTFDQWDAAFRWCNGVVRASPFWIGDLLVFGEQKFGDMYRAALEFTDYTPETLRNIKYVAASVHLSRRRDALSFNHHANVAPLPPDQQAKWLERAEMERLSGVRLHLPENVIGRRRRRRTLARAASGTDVVRCLQRRVRHCLFVEHVWNSRWTQHRFPDQFAQSHDAGLKLTLPDEVHERVDELLRNIKELREAIQFCWKP